MTHDHFRFCPFCRAPLDSGAVKCSNCNNGVDGFPVRLDAPQPELDLPLRPAGLPEPALAAAPRPPAVRRGRKARGLRWAAAVLLLASPGVVWLAGRGDRGSDVVAAAPPVAPPEFVQPEAALPAPAGAPPEAVAPATVAPPAVEAVAPTTPAAPRRVPIVSPPAAPAEPVSEPTPALTPEPFRPEPPDAAVEEAGIPSERAHLEDELAHALKDARKLDEKAEHYREKRDAADDPADQEKAERQLQDTLARQDSNDREIARLRRLLSR